MSAQTYRGTVTRIGGPSLVKPNEPTFDVLMDDENDPFICLQAERGESLKVGDRVTFKADFNGDPGFIGAVRKDANQKTDRPLVEVRHPIKFPDRPVIWIKRPLKYMVTGTKIVTETIAMHQVEIERDIEGRFIALGRGVDTPRTRLGEFLSVRTALEAAAAWLHDKESSKFEEAP